MSGSPGEGEPDPRGPGAPADDLQARTRELFPRAYQRDVPMKMHSQSHTAVDLLALDHVALSSADPEALAAFLCEKLGMQELERSGETIVVAAGENATRLTLSPAGGPTQPGALVRLVLRVSDLRRALSSLEPGTRTEEEEPGTITFTGPEELGIGLTFMAGGAVEYDLDHLVLRVADPEQTRLALAEVGCVPRGEALHVADKGFVIEPGASPTERPLLHHVAVRIRSVEAVSDQARRRGLDVHTQDRDDAFAIILPGPERLRLDFVE